MSDPSLKLGRKRLVYGQKESPPVQNGASGGDHSSRKHSKFSASGAERWFNCPGSVELSEDIPDRDSWWSLEGTRAHELLEAVLTDKSYKHLEYDGEMEKHVKRAADFIRIIHQKNKDSVLLAEKRIHLDFIEPEMFGTFDAAVVDYFGTLHVFDFKYGGGFSVSARNNLQMIFYGLGLAARYHWNFNIVRMWIIQPRIKGYDGPTFFELSIEEMKMRALEFEHAVRNVKENPKVYKEGDWCHWCKAKSICPLKQKQKLEKAIDVFTNAEIDD